MCRAVYIGYIIFHTIVFLSVFFDSALRCIDCKVISNDGGSKLVSSVLFVFLRYFETLCTLYCVVRFVFELFPCLCLWLCLWCGIPAECV